MSALPAAGSPRELVVVYTPLHGVGDETVERAMARAGFAAPLVVAEQAEPDADFPTVSFPNPEEPGAMDLAMALADREPADLVVANDPDADRCAVAVPTAHGWRMLRGDEVGALLADHLLRRGVRGVFATTIVSSSLLGRMAAAARRRVRGDADRLQVDRPGARSGLRLRGGARLLRRARPGPRQGRRLGPAAGRRAGRRAEGRRPHPARPARRDRGRHTGCTPPTSCPSGSRTCR